MLFLKVEASILYFFYKFRVRRQGFKAISNTIKYKELKNPKSINLSFNRIIKSVEEVVPKYEKQNQCLYLSLVGLSMLRRRNYNVKPITGVRFHPFESHLWIEMEGERFFYGDIRQSYNIIK